LRRENIFVITFRFGVARIDTFIRVHANINKGAIDSSHLYLLIRNTYY